ncbi:MAG: CRISPR-associated protein Csx11, partial [Lentisphaerae bacterium]|nr:CRISPR-associated protein Csx11 [Lentisphaerota bacterium]
MAEQMDGYARDANLEMPPYCHISEPSRSLVGMTAEIRKARETMAVPLHRNWQIPGQDSPDGHVCPVCLVRRSRSGTDKQRPCDPCKERRTHRLNMWLKGESGSDSIWISEVADANDRVALVTMSLDIEPWLDGTRLDALRTQAIPEWRKFNPELLEFWQKDENKRTKEPNPINIKRPLDSLQQEIMNRLGQFKEDDLLLCNLQEGYRHAKVKNDKRSDDEIWNNYFSLIVEDRTPDDQPEWKKDDLGRNAAWLAHQLFCKLASPGRIYRFEREAEDFFKALLAEFREIAAADQNRWRVRRLVIKPDNGFSGSWEDRQTCGGRYGDAPVSLLYREQTKDFLTICNLARLLKPEQDKDCLRGITLELKADDSMDAQRLVVHSAADDAGALGVYHPVIPLELSPMRFRVLLPLDAASACVDKAIEKWQEQFGCVWDRLPLRVGVVAFPRMTPFQAVIEATRNIEDELYEKKEPEIWRVTGYEAREGVTALSLKSLDHPHELLKTIPIRLPDGRDDVFYPYLTVEDKQVRFSLDFQHPNGQVFRHAKDLRSGDGVLVYPSLIATIFMDSTARRFKPLSRRQLTEWLRMRDLWRLMDRHAQSQTALREAWSELIERRGAWQGPDGTWFEGG